VKVCILGLDGATWDLLMPWIEEGKLPTFSMLVKAGVWGKLESTVPPVTSPAWVSLATGMNPGKLGIFDFLSRKDYSYKAYRTTSSAFRRQAIWDYLAADNRRKVGIVNYAMLSPYEINGFIVSNTIFHRTGDTTFPSALKEELDQICDGYQDYIAYQEKEYNDTGLFLKDVNNVLDKQFAAIRYLMEQPCDFFIWVLSATDWVQHLMWKYIDASHPLHNPEESAEYRLKLLEFWQRIDDFLRQAIEKNRESNFLIVSDHGFGPQDECFNLAKWLEMKGYLRRSRGGKIFTGAKNSIMSLLNAMVKTALGKKVPRTFAKKVSSTFEVDITDEIDFARSKVYVLGHTIPFGAIYINLEGREPQGCVKKEEYEILKAQIIDELKNLSVDIGKDVEVQIFSPEELYWGPYVTMAPDIIFTIDNWRCSVIERRFDGPLFKNEPFSNRHTGAHRMNGIFLAYGPEINDGGAELSGLTLYDIAPTVLHMFGVPIPNDVDGRVLSEIFRSDSEIAKRPLRYVDAGEVGRLKSRIIQLRKSGRL